MGNDIARSTALPLQDFVDLFFRMVEIRLRLEPLRVSTMLTPSTNSYCVGCIVRFLEEWSIIFSG